MELKKLIYLENTIARTLLEALCPFLIDLGAGNCLSMTVMRVEARCG